jgi:hypothetical protein
MLAISGSVDSASPTERESELLGLQVSDRKNSMKKIHWREDATFHQPLIGLALLYDGLEILQNDPRVTNREFAKFQNPRIKGTDVDVANFLSRRTFVIHADGVRST